MNWLVLIASGLMESVWAIALSKSEGFSHAAPTLVFFVALTLSMAGLGYATKTLPIGVAYAVWTGIGVVATAAVSMASGMEAASLAKVVLIGGILVCVVGLRVLAH